MILDATANKQRTHGSDTAWLKCLESYFEGYTVALRARTARDVHMTQTIAPVKLGGYMFVRATNKPVPTL